MYTISGDVYTLSVPEIQISSIVCRWMNVGLRVPFVIWCIWTGGRRSGLEITRLLTTILGKARDPSHSWKGKWISFEIPVFMCIVFLVIIKYYYTVNFLYPVSSCVCSLLLEWRYFWKGFVDISHSKTIYVAPEQSRDRFIYSEQRRRFDNNPDSRWLIRD